MWLVLWPRTYKIRKEQSSLFRLSVSFQPVPGWQIGYSEKYRRLSSHPKLNWIHFNLSDLDHPIKKTDSDNYYYFIFCHEKPICFDISDGPYYICICKIMRFTWRDLWKIPWDFLIKTGMKCTLALLFSLPFVWK